MTREEAKAAVEPHVYSESGYSAVTRPDAWVLLGEHRYRLLSDNAIKGRGPTPGTFYPWNVIDALLWQPTATASPIGSRRLLWPGCPCQKPSS